MERARLSPDIRNKPVSRFLAILLVSWQLAKKNFFFVQNAKI